VPYLPCGVEEILAMVAGVPLREEDTVVDLGSGLGRVAILAHLLSGAPARGVEIQEHLVRAARACAAALALPAVSFLHANATDAELDGSVFFLYAPFNGETLRHVLRRLRHVAARNPIIVCAVGVEFRHDDWLLSRASSCAGVTVYESRVPGVAR
jgi:predicted RNA methylase